MHPDHRIATFREALRQWQQQPEGGLWLWIEPDNRDWLGLGMGPRHPRYPVWHVIERVNDALKVEVFLHDPEQVEEFRRHWPDVPLPESVTDYPVRAAWTVPLAEAEVHLDRLLHRLVDPDEEKDIVWYGRADRPEVPPRVYTMGCLSVWWTLSLLGVIILWILFGT